MSEHRASEYRVSQHRVFEHRVFEHGTFQHGVFELELSKHGFLSMVCMAQGSKSRQSDSQGRSPLPLEPLV